MKKKGFWIVLSKKVVLRLRDAEYGVWDLFSNVLLVLQEFGGEIVDFS